MVIWWSVSALGSLLSDHIREVADEIWDACGEVGRVRHSYSYSSSNNLLHSAPFPISGYREQAKFSGLLLAFA
jgi:hypothetical protein